MQCTLSVECQECGGNCIVLFQTNQEGDVYWDNGIPGMQCFRMVGADLNNEWGENRLAVGIMTWGISKWRHTVGRGVDSPLSE